MINKKNLIIYVLSGITLISFIGALFNTPAFLAFISYCLGMATMREIKRPKDE
jgi:hypothetical protein